MTKLQPTAVLHAMASFTMILSIKTPAVHVLMILTPAKVAKRFSVYHVRKENIWGAIVVGAIIGIVKVVATIVSK